MAGRVCSCSRHCRCLAWPCRRCPSCSAPSSFCPPCCRFCKPADQAVTFAHPAVPFALLSPLPTGPSGSPPLWVGRPAGLPSLLLLQKEPREDRSGLCGLLQKEPRIIVGSKVGCTCDRLVASRTMAAHDQDGRQAGLADMRGSSRAACGACWVAWTKPTVLKNEWEGAAS
eukprot:1159649-Pelagomonas_calceolata.AAC.10